MKLIIKTELIKNYITTNNLTVKEFCEKCKISQNTYYRIVKGYTKIRISTLYRILVQTNLFCEDILFWQEN